jgi:hypothetical protein
MGASDAIALGGTPAHARRHARRPEVPGAGVSKRGDAASPKTNAVRGTLARPHRYAAASGSAKDEVRSLPPATAFPTATRRERHSHTPTPSGGMPGETAAGRPMGGPP